LVPTECAGTFKRQVHSVGKGRMCRPIPRSKMAILGFAGMRGWKPILHRQILSKSVTFGRMRGGDYQTILNRIGPFKPKSGLRLLFLNHCARFSIGILITRRCIEPIRKELSVKGGFDRWGHNPGDFGGPSRLRPPDRGQNKIKKGGYSLTSEHNGRFVLSLAIFRVCHCAH
jgi:hypothetical protein